VGSRHVVSDGVNDLGCIGEAHLKSYVASLPGALCGTALSATRTAFAGAALKDLTLRRDGDRHVVVDGQNELGEIEDGSLKAYALRLPGAYYECPEREATVTAPPARPQYPPSAAVTGGNVVRSVRSGPPTAAGIKPGSADALFTAAVQKEKAYLLSRDSRLSELEAHRQAIQRVGALNRSLVAAYKADVREL
jgi:hypothetical protein